jgi:photosystem II PsbY protein
MDMDMRVVIVLAPVVIAASWAVFNIGAAALRQVQNFLNKEA